MSFGAIHVWRADLDAAAREYEPGGLLEMLTGEERERAASFRRELAGRRWGTARAVLRVLLGRYLDRDPSRLAFVLSPTGKPSLSTGELRFNVAHSGSLALYGFARSGAIGVDLEASRPVRSWRRIAQRAFGPREARRLAALDPSIRDDEFLRGWTRYEALRKCSGTGSATKPRSGASGPGHWVGELELGGDGVAAIASRPAPRELRCWSLALPATEGRSLSAPEER